jgi:hypothetical protein
MSQIRCRDRHNSYEKQSPQSSQIEMNVGQEAEKLVDCLSGTACNATGAREHVTMFGRQVRLYTSMAAVALNAMYATALKLSIWSHVPNL